MAIVGLITLVVAIIGLLIWLALTGFARATFAEMGRLCFFAGLLAFLIASSSQSCSIGTGGAGTSGGGNAGVHSTH
jgi:hypothetical protein